MAQRITLNYANVLWLLAFILASLYTFSFCYWGRGCEDPYYWLSIYESADTNLSLSSGTIIIGHFWGILFGNSILSFRILGWLCCFLAMCLPYCCIYQRNQWLTKVNILPLLISLILMGYGTFNEFSPGTISFLLLSICTLFLYKYWVTGKIAYCFLCGLAAGVAIWCRFPNLMVVPIVVAAIEYKGHAIDNKREGLSATVCGFLILTFLSYIILLISSSGSFNIISTISNSFSAGNSGGHSVHDLIKQMYEGLNSLFIYTTLAFLFYYVIRLIENKASRGLQQNLLYVLVVLFFFYFLKENIGIHKWFNCDLHLLQSSISIFMLILVNFKLINSGYKNLVYCLDFCFLTLMVLPLGSDVGWLKLFPALLVPIPFMAKLLKIKYKNPAGMAILGTLLSVSIIAYGNNNISKGVRNTTIGMTERTNAKVLKGIRISKSNLSYINNLVEDVQTCAPDKNVIFYGDLSHFAYSITEVDKQIKHPFFCDPNDSSHIRAISQKLIENEALLFDFERHEWDFLHKELDRVGYRKIKEGENYEIYALFQETDGQ